MLFPPLPFFLLSLFMPLSFFFLFFFFNDTATTEIYTLSLHDALPISLAPLTPSSTLARNRRRVLCWIKQSTDRKSTRLNSSHSQISYAVFCLKKKKYTPNRTKTIANQYKHTL